MGRSGFLPHIVLLALFVPVVALGWRLHTVLNVALIAGTFALIGGVARRRSVLPFALAAGLVTALIPFAASHLIGALAGLVGWHPPFLLRAGLTIALAAFAGTLVFGAFLVLLTLIGYEHMQALTVLDHPGFKHFLRLRVRADGSGIDGWCIGATDPLRPGQRPELVDRFTWRPASRRRPA
jgi:hypothetical protein